MSRSEAAKASFTFDFTHRLIQNINYDDYLDCAGYINQSRPAANATSSAHLEFPRGILLTNPAAAGERERERERCSYYTTK